MYNTNSGGDKAGSDGKVGGMKSGKSGKKTLLESKPDEIANMTRKELQDSIPEGWDFQDHNGQIHIKDENKNPLDNNGNIVSPKDRLGHIPYND